MSVLESDAVTAATGTNTNLALTGKGTGKVALGDAALLVPDADGAAGQILTTNGSLALTFAATPGTSGNVLTSNGSAWTSAAAAAGAWSSVAAGTLSASSGLNVTGITATTIFFLNMLADTQFGSVCMRTSSDAGSSYDSGASDYYRNNIDQKQGTTGYVFNAGNLSRILLSGAVGSSETKYVSIKGTLIRPQDAQETIVITEYGGWGDTGAGDLEYFGRSMGMRNSAADVDAFQIYADPGTLTGTYEIFQL